ncbi:MAG: hypothetical protein P4M00_10125 [Azospirillaceae bacterium]|nr:hypothetical protein [Azospirillaceae bacterium]
MASPETQRLPPSHRSRGRARIYRALVILAALLLRAGPVIDAASAQTGPGLGGPQQGEVILNQDSDVHSLPTPEGKVVMTLAKGRTVVAFDTPRNTGWTQIAIGGRDIGYVPYDHLTSIYVVREVTSHAAVISTARWAAGRMIPISQIAAKPVSAKQVLGHKTRRIALAAGTGLGFVAMRGSEAMMMSESDANLLVPVSALLPIVGTYPNGARPGANFFLAKVGDYPTSSTAHAAWSQLVATFPEYQVFSPFVYPVITEAKELHVLAFGPLTRDQANNQCITLAQKLRDCWIVEATSY